MAWTIGSPVKLTHCTNYYVFLYLIYKSYNTTNKLQPPTSKSSEFKFTVSSSLHSSTYCMFSSISCSTNVSDIARSCPSQKENIYLQTVTRQSTKMVYISGFCINPSRIFCLQAFGGCNCGKYWILVLFVKEVYGFDCLKSNYFKFRSVNIETYLSYV